MEYAPNGSLQNLIHGDSHLSHKELKPYDLIFILKILKQIARALVYLHTSDPPVIHRDLKPSNIVLDINNNVKLTDFGLATIKKEVREYNNETSGKGTLRWMAPELISENLTEKSDIYSFGMIIWELFSRKFPYPDAKNDIQIFQSIKARNWKFKFNENTLHAPPKLVELGERCLNYDKEKRPTAVDILYELEHNI